MKRFRKFLCLFLGVVVMMSYTNVAAQELQNADIEAISPRYTNMSRITSTLGISGNKATCEGICKMTDNKTCEITMTLQRCTKSDKAYTPYRTWTQTFSGTGKKTLSKTVGVDSGYYYRVQVVVKIYSGSKLVEAGAKYSSEVWH